MNKYTAVVCEPDTLRQTCTHFWIIQNANGPVSRGVCRHCGVTREFKNYPNDCAIENTSFRELFGKSGQDEPEWNNPVESEYIDKAAVAGQEDDEYEEEPEALCSAV